MAFRALLIPSRHPQPFTPFALGLCQRSARADPHAGSCGDSLWLSPDRVQVSRLSCVPRQPLPAPPQ